jgi:hypothetical protein
MALVEDEVISDAIFEDIDGSVESELLVLDQNKYEPSSVKSTAEDVCRTITVDHPDTTGFPKIVTIDYGDGCTFVFNSDTITKKGKIVVTITDRYFITGSQRIMTFYDFYINDVKVEGTRTITNLGMNEQGHLEFSIQLRNGKLIFNDNTFVTCEADKTREWVRTTNWVTDTVFVTGSSTGININGEVYVREITEPLVLIHCANYKHRWTIVDGTVVTLTGDNPPVTVDHGDGSCDKEVSVQRDGNERSFEFHYRHQWRYRKSRG